MRNIRKVIRKHWIAIWMVAAVLSCSVFLTYAAFTRINIVKRVISTDAGAGDRFSSDCLDSTASGMTTRKSFTNQTDDANVEVNIFNYPYPKASLFRNTATEYDVTAKIGTHDGTSFTPLTGADLTTLSNAYYMNYKNGTNQLFNAGAGTLIFNDCYMAAGSVSPDCFNVHFANAELGNTPPGYCVEMVATPKDSSLPILKGYISVRYVKRAESGWTGELEELSDSVIYDGYNYILEGSGTGRITFEWNPTYVTINKQFLQNPSNTYYINGANVTGNSNLSLTEDDFATDATSGMKSLTLVVDSQARNRYEIQFFKTDSNNSSYDYQVTAIKTYIPDSSDWQEIISDN